MNAVIMQETKVCIPLFKDIPGGPMWFHYDCRCEAEANLILRATQVEIDSADRELKARKSNMDALMEDMGTHQVKEHNRLISRHASERSHDLQQISRLREEVFNNKKTIGRLNIKIAKLKEKTGRAK